MTRLRHISRRILTGILGWISFIASAAPASGPFQTVGVLPAPAYNYSFLAATPDGNLLAATFNSMPAGNPPKELPALLVQGPTSATPQVLELCRVSFESQRGYSGIACDDKGFFYVSGDTGDPATCFVRKYASNGAPVASFGANGIVRPNRRCLGLDVFDRYLVLAVDWGMLQIYDAESGQLLNSVPQAATKPYVRDVAIDPRSLSIFGVAEGSVVSWDDGTPWEPAKYRFTQKTPKSGQLRAGEGISIDAPMGNILITPIPGNVLHEINAAGEVRRTTVSTALETAHLADSVVSFDGSTLFVSDMIARTIHVMRRDMGGVASDTGGSASYTVPSAPAAATGNAAAPAINWQPTYTGVVEEARRRNAPMFVYFRRSGFKRCEEFENNILLSGYFNQIGQPFVCVFEDVAKNQLLAYRFGIVRVPAVVLLDGQGQTVEQFTFDIDTLKMFTTMQAMTKTP